VNAKSDAMRESDNSSLANGWGGATDRGGCPIPSPRRDERNSGTRFTSDPPMTLIGPLPRFS